MENKYIYLERYQTQYMFTEKYWFDGHDVINLNGKIVHKRGFKELTKENYGAK